MVYQSAGRAKFAPVVTVIGAASVPGVLPVINPVVLNVPTTVLRRNTFTADEVSYDATTPVAPDTA